MKRKLFVVLLAIVSALCLAFGLSACDFGEVNVHTHTYSEEWTSDDAYHWHAATCEHTDEVNDKTEHNFVDGKCSVCGYEQTGQPVQPVDPPVQPHEHTYAESWTSDITYHWHAATCEHTDEISGKAEHSFIDGVCSVCGYEQSEQPVQPVDPPVPPHEHSYAETTVDPTCTEQGYVLHTCECGDSYKDNYIAALGHDYQISWIWDGNNSATATFTCKNDKTHVEMVNATITSKITTAATCEATGLITYTATVPFGNKTYSYEITKTIPALGHDYQISWSWNGNDSATATFTCKNDKKHIETVDATITSETIAVATCESAGLTTYTATATFGNETYTDEKTETTDAFGHDYQVSWNWSGYDSATATFTCKNDDTHVETVDATITSKVTTAATCEAAGLTTYTATATFGNKTYSYETTKTIPVLGHDYQISWSWNGRDSATATFTCKNDDTHVETVDATITSEVTTASTCEATGLTTYTATVTFGNETYTDGKTETTNVLGHDYQIYWNWNGYDSAAATFTCKNDKKHIEIVDATITSEVTTAATCESAGLIVYTATVAFGNETYTDVKTETTDVLGHDYQVSWNWSGYDSATATFTCKNDDTHVETVDATITSRTTATCTESGVQIYIATVTFDGNIYTDEQETDKVAVGHDWNDNVCSRCGFDAGGTKGMKWALNSSDTYTVSGIGFANGAIEIPSIYNGLSVTSIGQSAFYNCSGLTSITIPDSVTSIGDYAFEYCSSLTSVTIGTGVTSIGNDAFRNCTALTEINYNATACEDLSSKNYVFHNAGQDGEGITVNIGSSVTKIPAYLFYPYDTSYAPKIVTVNFAENSVCESIGSSAFYGCSSLTSITIPDSVTSIGNSAFSGCSLLTNITIPDSVTSIGDYAFFYCSSLESITIPDSVTSIGDYAFYNCRSLESITIPDSVTSIGISAFSGCTSLTEINYNAAACADLSSENHVFSHAGQSGEGITVNIGSSVTKIPAYLFYPYGASSYAPKIVTVNFAENSVCESIGSSAFPNCSSLMSITIPGSVKSIGSSAFSNCNSLTSITIPDGVTSIGSFAFYGCSSLTNVTIGNGVTSIGNVAFGDCSSLTSVTIGTGVTSIGISAFRNCTSLTEINYNATTCEDLIINNYVFSYAGQSGEGITVNIGANVTKIPAYLFDPGFSNTPKIVTVNFADNGVCESIGTHALDCGWINAVYITNIAAWCGISFSYAYDNPLSYAGIYLNGELVTELTIPDGVTSIGNYAFYGCSGLTSITIPDSVTSIGDYAFEYCSSLTSVTIGTGVTSIGNDAFRNCTALTEINYNATACEDLSSKNYVFHNAGQDGEGITVNIGSSVTKIPAYLFYPYDTSYAPKIVTVNFAENSVCESIGSSVFYGCSSLTSITIPNGVTSIGNSAFSGCSGLTNIYYAGDVAGWCNITGLDNLMRYGNSSKSLYLNETLVTELIIPDTVTVIPGSAFYGCTSLTSITIPDGVTSIGHYAFYDCTALIEINYNAENLSACSDWSIYNAGQSSKGITVNIGANVTKIPSSLFSNSKIVTVNFAENSVCESIGSSAFSKCSSLTSITIPDGVTSIGSSAFYGCSSLNYNEYDNAYYLGNQNNPYLVLIEAKNTSITSCIIHENTRIIYGGALYNCSSLTSITIPNNLTSIGDRAFLYCYKLAEVYNLSSLNVTKGSSDNGYVGYYALNVYTLADEQSKLTTTDDGYIFYEDGEAVYLVGYKGTETHITLPDSFNEKNYAIYQCAFYNNSSLTSIIIPDSVTSIGWGAFAYCDSLTSVTIGNGVTSIGDAAFVGCTLLETVYITDIAAWCGISFGYDGSNPLNYARNLYLNGELVTELAIPDGVTSIGNYAFSNCSGLTSITIPDSVTSIGDYAFRGCYKLVEVYNISSLNITKGSSDNGYAGYYALNVYTLADEQSKLTTTDDGYIFYEDGEAVYLVGYKGTETELILPDKFDGKNYVINQYAFNDCSSLTSITIGEGVTSIGNSAFRDCTALTEINFNAAVCEDLIINNHVFSHAGQSGEGITVNIGANVTKIPDYLFYPYSEDPAYAPKIVIVKFADNSVCESIGYCAFKYCSSLISITIPDSVTSIEAAFYNCDKLVEVYNMSSLNITKGSGDNGYVGYYALNVYTPTSGESKLTTTSDGYIFYEDEETVFLVGYKGTKTELTLPDKFNGKNYAIYQYAFEYCSSLMSITISDGVNNIGGRAFYYCRGLTSVTIGNGVTGIGSVAFSGCSSLTSVTIGSSVTSIGSSAFYGCDSLTAVYFKGVEKEWSNINIDSSNSSLKSATRYYYSESNPFEGENAVTSGNYWHYDTDGVTPVIWTKEN